MSENTVVPSNSSEFATKKRHFAQSLEAFRDVPDFLVPAKALLGFPRVVPQLPRACRASRSQWRQFWGCQAVGLGLQQQVTWIDMNPLSSAAAETPNSICKDSGWHGFRGRGRVQSRSDQHRSPSDRNFKESMVVQRGPVVQACMMFARLPL